MKRVLIASILALACLPAVAAADNIPAIVKYVERLLPSCPGEKTTIEPVKQDGPSGFNLYIATKTSTDAACSAKKYVLYSPATEQILMGQIFSLPQGPSLQTRLEEEGTTLLKQPIHATIDRTPLPDGLKKIAIVKDSNAGPFPYHAYVDASERYMVIGFRGSLKTDAGRTMLDTLGVKNGARRGTQVARTEIVELSDLECPTCARVHQTLEPLVAKNLSHVSWVRLDLPLFEHHAWALRAAMAARALQRVAPGQYWGFVDFVFQNQETIGKTDFDKVFRDYCADHEIDWKTVEKQYNSDSERKALLEQVSRAFDNGILSTPTLFVNGQQIGFADGGEYTLNQLKQAITGKAVSSSKPASKTKSK
jgi:protein-disulfide isomerase